MLEKDIKPNNNLYLNFANLVLWNPVTLGSFVANQERNLDFSEGWSNVQHLI